MIAQFSAEQIEAMRRRPRAVARKLCETETPPAASINLVRCIGELLAAAPAGARVGLVPDRRRGCSGIELRAYDRACYAAQEEPCVSSSV